MVLHDLLPVALSDGVIVDGVTQAQQGQRFISGIMAGGQAKTYLAIHQLRLFRCPVAG